MELLRPSSTAEAIEQLRPPGARALAGGTELVPLIRDGIVATERLVHVSGVVPRGVRGQSRDSPLTIGAGTTLAALEVDPQVPEALREACRLAASPQLRNMGTIGGNLLQATRCWYWRLRFPCRLHGGDVCHARAGQHREHAIFANDFCASAHPSDVAAALLALDARVRTSRREFPVADLYRLPTADDREVTTIEAGELILELELRAPLASTYLKAMDRKRWAFALVGVAAARHEDGIRLGLAGVAPVPWSLSSLDELEAATPLSGTAYKVDLARALGRRAIAAVTG